MFTTTTWTYLCYKFKLNNKKKGKSKEQTWRKMLKTINQSHHTRLQYKKKKKIKITITETTVTIKKTY